MEYKLRWRGLELLVPSLLEAQSHTASFRLDPQYANRDAVAFPYDVPRMVDDPGRQLGYMDEPLDRSLDPRKRAEVGHLGHRGLDKVRR